MSWAILGVILVPLGVIFAIGLVAILWGVGIYNRLIRLLNEVKNSWSQIDVQLKRRHDLIPNLVETVKGYASHEQGTLDAVISARSKAVNASGVPEQMMAEQQLSGALGRMMLLVESYPDLKANQNFLALQEELTSTENKISFARQYYNDSAMQFNNGIQQFPSNILAGMFNFKEQAFFEVEDEAERQAPQVKF